MKNYEDLTIVLDRSGSMSSIANDMVKGFQHFVEKEKESGDVTKVTLYTFNNTSRCEYTSRDINEIFTLDLRPLGSTALMDALGRAINETGARLSAIPENDRPEKVVVMVITDGEENASREYTLLKIKEMVEHQKTKYNWQFVFSGANIDSFSVGGNYGVARCSTMNYMATPAGTQHLWESLSVSQRAYRSADAGTMFSIKEPSITEETYRNHAKTQINANTASFAKQQEEKYADNSAELVASK